MEKVIIIIGRQYGAGGRYIAKRLATTFGAKYLDREILDLAAKESGFSPEFFKENDEKKNFLKSLFHMHAPMVSDNSFYGNEFSEESLFCFQCEAIRKAADEGSCVFIGRCADYVLRDVEGVVSVFITADMDDRLARVRERLQVDEETARKTISRKESSRESFYNYYTGKKWGTAESYDLCINSSLLGLDGTADFIAKFVTERTGVAPQKPWPQEEEL